MRTSIAGLAVIMIATTMPAAAMTCTDSNVGGSGWRQQASCSQNGKTFSCTIVGSGPGAGFSYSAQGTGEIRGSRPGGQRISARWTGKAFVGNYRDGAGKAWPIRLSC